jgi:hypothetical protein
LLWHQNMGSCWVRSPGHSPESHRLDPALLLSRLYLWRLPDLQFINVVFECSTCLSRPSFLSLSKFPSLFFFPASLPSFLPSFLFLSLSLFSLSFCLSFSLFCLPSLPPSCPSFLFSFSVLGSLIQGLIHASEVLYQLTTPQPPFSVSSFSFISFPFHFF